MRSMESALTTERIRQHHADSDSTSGMPHVRADLIEAGHRINRKRVAWLRSDARSFASAKSIETIARNQSQTIYFFVPSLF